MSHLLETTCPAIEATEEWRAASTALEAIGRGCGGCASEADATVRFASAFDRLHKLAAAEGEYVSRAGAIAALELLADPGAEAEPLGVDDCRALAALALRHLRTATL